MTALVRDALVRDALEKDLTLSNQTWAMSINVIQIPISGRSRRGDVYEVLTTGSWKLALGTMDVRLPISVGVLATCFRVMPAGYWACGEVLPNGARLFATT